jgi:hypothetical protein
MTAYLQPRKELVFGGEPSFYNTYFKKSLNKPLLSEPGDSFFRQ